MDNTTLNYYNAHALDFVQGTVGVDFHITQERFLAQLEEGASILDFGCGSGRDTKYFLERGFAVEATDGSAGLCKLASEYTGISVKRQLFDELEAMAKYDGIWTCASILHLAWEELVAVLQKMVLAVKAGGVIYTSFKYGQFMGERNGSCEVVHFILWPFVKDDKAWNFVQACKTCNGSKKDKLAGPQFMGTVITRNKEILRMPLLVEAFKADFDGYRDERLPEMYKSAAFNGFEVGWEPKVS